MHRRCLVAALALFVLLSSVNEGSAAPGDPILDDDAWQVKGALAAFKTGDPELVPRAITLLADLNVVSAFDEIAAQGEKLLAPGADKAPDANELRDAVSYALGKLRMRSEISIPLLLRFAEMTGYSVYSTPCNAFDPWRFAEDIAASAMEALRAPPPKHSPQKWYGCVGVWDAAGIDYLLSLPAKSQEADFIKQRIFFSEEIEEKLKNVEKGRRDEILAQRELMKPPKPESSISLLEQLQKISEAPEETSTYFPQHYRSVFAQLSALREDATAAKLRPGILAHLDAKLRDVSAARASTDEEVGYALLAVGPLERADALGLIERTHIKPGLGGEQTSFLRFWAIALTGGDPLVTLAARWLSPTSARFAATAPADKKQLASDLKEVLEAAQVSEGIKISSASAGMENSAIDLLLRVLRDNKWTSADREFLEGLRAELKAPQYEEVRAQIQLILDGLEGSEAAPESLPLRVGRWALATFGLHFIVWLGLLVTVYPRSRTVQAAMLFNPLGRAVTGWGYTQLLIMVSAGLRRRMFHPLVGASSDTEVVSFDAASFYDQIRVAPLRRPKSPQAPVEVLPPIQWTELAKMSGLIVIEGASGLGKTHVLKALLEKARAAGKTCLFVRASECNSGVIKELEERLAIDHASGFVRSMLHRGAIELFIDGMNEASPGGVAEIAQFCERATAARILITTQPMTWACPRRAKQFRLLPLEAGELEAFLVAQWPAARVDDSASPEADAAAKAVYRERIKSFLAERTAPHEVAVLQNRIDLAFVAHLLARGGDPNIHSLRKQVVDDAARAYETAAPGGAFPLTTLATAAVRVLETGRPMLELDDLDPAVLPHLAERKLLLRRGDASWMFRHDTITSYFAAAGYFAPKILASTAAGAAEIDPEAIKEEHLSSPRFLGVYLQLAEALPEHAAEAFAAALREHGRRSNDRSVEIAFQDRLDDRQDRH